MELKTPIPQSVMDSLNDYIANNIPASYVLPYKTYVALLTQTGTSAPTATVLENTLGFTPTWVRVGAGQYSIQTAFTTTKTTVSLQPRYGVNLVLFASPSTYLVIGTATSFTTSYADGTLGDEFLKDSMIEIRVYP